MVQIRIVNLKHSFLNATKCRFWNRGDIIARRIVKEKKRSNGRKTESGCRHKRLKAM